MQRILGYMRKAVQEFELLENGDKIAVGVSGGKDSMVLLYGLVLLKRFAGIDYDVVAITADPGFNGVCGDYSEIERFCDKIGVEYIIKRTEIANIVFDVRKEKSPCSLCAKMRRGVLHETTLEAGCNKIALGHHYNDVIETFLMNLFIEGRVGCFAPKSWLSKRNITLIRPLCLAPEYEVRNAANRNDLPIHKSVCPADGVTQRQKMKDFIRQMDKENPGFSDRIFTALRKSGVDDWGFR